jgi:hypothetical protein
LIQDEKTWLLAKARTLKEHAIGTADRTSRAHLLKLAGECQKLAHAGLPAGNALASDRIPPEVDRYGERPSPAKRLSHSRSRAKSSADTDNRSKRADIYGIMLLGVLTLLAFTLVMIPGDQTLEGLRALAADIARF